MKRKSLFLTVQLSLVLLLTCLLSSVFSSNSFKTAPNQSPQLESKRLPQYSDDFEEDEDELVDTVQKGSLDQFGLPTDPVFDDIIPDNFPEHNPHEPRELVSKAGISLALVDRAVNSLQGSKSFSKKALENLMDETETAVNETDAVYSDIGKVYDQVDQIYKNLDQNYSDFNGLEAKTPEVATAFNETSREMEGRVGVLRANVDSIRHNVEFEYDAIAERIAKVEKLQQYQQNYQAGVRKLKGQVKDAEAEIGQILPQLEQQDFPVKEAKWAKENFFKRTNRYIGETEKNLQSRDNTFKQTKQFLSNRQEYLGKVKEDLNQTVTNLDQHQDYLAMAQVKPGPGEDNPQGSAICRAAEPKGMDTWKECNLSCNTMCLFKKKVAGVDCFSCTSGSPDTCFDVGAWPADHDWCKPGGICHSDPMMYCNPFGTFDPQGMQLQCTNCKKRPDMCWQKVKDGTTTFTNCKLGCWDGTCEYRGKYTEYEWDGTGERIHCFECVTPIPPPSCEELGYGYDYEDDCLDDCPGGTCREVKHKLKGELPGQDPKPGDGGGQDGGQQGGQQGGGQQAGDGGKGGQDGGQSGSDTKGGDDKKGGTTGNDPKPPKGDPNKPTGGGGGAPAIGGQPADSGKTGQPTDGGKQNPPPNRPDTSKPTQPTKPKDTKPDTGTEPKDPEPPITNVHIEVYKGWLERTKARIKYREDLLKDPTLGESTKTLIREQLKEYYSDVKKLEADIERERDRVRKKRAEEEARKKRAEEWRRTREKNRKKEKTLEQRLQEMRLKELREATENLREKVKEAKDGMGSRKRRIEQTQKEIKLIEKEIEHNKTGIKEERIEEDHATTQIRKLEKKLKEKKEILRILLEDAKKQQKRFEEEIGTLRREYNKKLYAVDPAAKQKEDMKRIKEYHEAWNNLTWVRSSKKVSMAAYDSMVKKLEEEIARRKKNDEDLGDLETELENMKRGRDEWEALYDRRVKSAERDLERIQTRNFFDGVGPSSYESLVNRQNDYADKFDKQIKQNEQVISQLGNMEKDGFLNEQGKAELEKLRKFTKSLIEARDNMRNSIPPREYPLTEDDVKNLALTAARVAQGSRGNAEAKSLLRLFLEELPQEVARTMRPDIAFKKYVAFNYGMAKGVGKALYGLGELAVKGSVFAGDLATETAGYYLGIETNESATDALYGAWDTVSSNADFDGLMKVINIVGKGIDKKFTELEKAKDVDWATAEFGGEVAGDVVLADAILAGIFSKIGKAAGLADEGADLARATDKAADARKAGDAAQTGTRVADEVKDLGKFDTPNLPDGPPSGAANAGDIGKGGKATQAAGKASDAVPPGTKVLDDPPPVAGAKRTPPPENNPIKSYDPATSKPTRGPPQEAKPVINSPGLKDTGRTAQRLSDDVAETLEKQQGFRKDHAQRMNEFAQEKGVHLIVRDGNPDSVKYFGKDDYMPKPMSSKAKTAKVGPDQGLVVDPTHPKQAKYWDEAIEYANRTDPEHGKWLQEMRDKAEKEWRIHGKKMQKKGYRVNKETGVIEYVETLPDGSKKVWKGIHGDYDLHGAYRTTPDGPEQVSFGRGLKEDAKGYDVEGGDLRRQLNSKLTGGKKDFIQHGGQDSWVPDPTIIPKKKPDPPATVFFPDGRPPVRLETAEQMRKFYEDEMGIKFPYADDIGRPKIKLEKPTRIPSTSSKAPATDNLPTGQTPNVPKTPKVPDAPPSNTQPAPPAGMSAAQDGIKTAVTAPRNAAAQAGSKAEIKALDGSTTSINRGKKLGSGATSDVFIDADFPTKRAHRVTEPYDPAVPKAQQLDNFGRQSLEDIQKADRAAGREPPVRVVERYGDQKMVIDSTDPALKGKLVETVELMPQGTAKDIIAKQGGKMTPAQTKALDDAVKRLNDEGYAWMDSHPENFTFEKIPGTDKVRVVVMDTGGIVPMRGNSVAEKAANAQKLQNRISNPRKEFVEELDGLRNMGLGENETARYLKMANDAERHDIIEKFGNLIETNKIEKGMTPDQVSFYPGSMTDLPDAQKAFRNRTGLAEQ